MAKYEFKAKGLDEFELHYQDKDGQQVIIPFKRTIELAKMLNSIDAEARFKMYSYLTSIGKTKNDLIIERTDAEGKIIVDETNYREFESNFLLQAQYEVGMKIYKTLFNMSLEDIITKIGLTEQESYLFGSKVHDIILNGLTESDDKIPSQTENELVSTTPVENQQNNI